MTDRDGAIKTRLMRGYGLSAEDADTVYALCAAEALERYHIDQQQTPTTSPDLQRVMQTVEGIGENTVTRTWVNVDAVADEIAPQVTALIADALVRAAQEGR